MVFVAGLCVPHALSLSKYGPSFVLNTRTMESGDNT